MSKQHAFKLLKIVCYAETLQLTLANPVWAQTCQPSDFEENEGVRSELDARAKFEALRDRMAEITLTFAAIEISDHADFQPILDKQFLDWFRQTTEFASTVRADVCRTRTDVLAMYASQVLGYEFGYVGFDHPDYRPVSFFNTPVQGNHSAIEIRIDGNWVFFDPSFGVYFEDASGQPLGYMQARWLFPNITVVQLDTDEGQALTHGRDLPETHQHRWLRYNGEELMRTHVPTFFSNEGNTGAWPNGDLLSLFFAVKAYPAPPLSAPLIRPEDVSSHDIYADGDGFTGLKLLFLSTPGQKIVLTGQGLQNVLIDVEPFGDIVQTYEQGRIFSEISDDGQVLELRSQFPDNGFVLTVQPTRAGRATVTGVRAEP